MINEMQSVKKNCQGMQVLIREFDIKFVDLIKKKKTQKKTILLNS